ncbi:MAG: hypothetical protein JSR31_06070 [Nitrospira sp.]|nr:hypothetical protein [Nitrospira sp.]
MGRNNLLGVVLATAAQLPASMHTLHTFLKAADFFYELARQAPYMHRH